jgi:hypothetical protein
MAVKGVEREGVVTSCDYPKIPPPPFPHRMAGASEGAELSDAATGSQFALGAAYVVTAMFALAATGVVEACRTHRTDGGVRWAAARGGGAVGRRAPAGWGGAGEGSCGPRAVAGADRVQRARCSSSICPG